MPNITVRSREELDQTVRQHVAVLGMTVLMDHGWITTLGDDRGHQISIMTRDATAPVNPDVSVFVEDIHVALDEAVAAGVEIVHPLTQEDWGVTRFFYRDTGGNVINVGIHS
ncbi:MAG: VOC family protein [Micrococcaceae bacterium]